MSEINIIKKRFIIILVLLFQSINLIAQETNTDYPVRGYRGFVDGNLGIGVYDGVFVKTSFSTSHGFQFNPKHYLGLGLDSQFYLYYDDGCWIDYYEPLFIDFRIDFNPNAKSKFLDLRFGCNFGTGYYTEVSYGFRIKKLNLAIGYSTLYDGYGLISSFADGLHSLFLKVGFDFGARSVQE